MVRVRDILQLPSFKGGELVAGPAGLDRVVTWITVSERMDPRLMDGGEFILTSGMRLRSASTAEQVACVRRLGEAGGSGLGVELVGWEEPLAPAMIAESERMGFPLVVWRAMTKFNLVTQEVSKFLLEQRAGSVVQEQLLTTDLMRLFLEEQGLEAMLDVARKRLARRVYLTGLSPAIKPLSSGSSRQWAALAQRPLSQQVQVTVEAGKEYLGVPVTSVGEVSGTLWVELGSTTWEQLRIPTERIAMLVSFELARQRDRHLIKGQQTDLVEELLAAGGEEELLRGRLAQERIPVGDWFGVVGMEIALLQNTQKSDEELLAQAGSEPGNLLCEVDWSEIDRRRIAWQFYRERRPDSYGSLTQLVP